MIFIIDEAYHVGLAHVHRHLSLVYLSEVHHLVDEVEDTLGVPVHQVVDALSVRILVFLDEREQWGEEEGERGANLMTDVHEEAQFCLAHLLGMDMLLQDESVFLLALTMSHIGIDKQEEYQEIDAFCPESCIPSRVNDDGELLDRSLVIVANGFHLKVISAWRQMGEGYLVDATLYLAPFLVVDAVGIDDLLHIIICKCG